MWMAEGFVEDEFIGRTYFQKLLSMCFFQVEVDNGSRELYKMHHLCHDLSEGLSKGDCYRIEDHDKVTKIPQTVRYLSIQGANLKKHMSNINKLKHLRTLIFFEPNVEDMTRVLEEILSNLTKLRVFYLNCTNICEMPESVCKLYNLQVLKFNKKVTNLPKNFCNLSKLHHLEAYNDNYEVQPVPPIPHMGKLTSLQHIATFHVGTEEPFKLWQLRNLNNLHGILKIMNLENVESKDEAIEARLHEKNKFFRTSIFMDH